MRNDVEDEGVKSADDNISGCVNVSGPPRHCSEAVHFITSCLNTDPRMRLNASQMLSHPWLRMCAVTPGESSRSSLDDRRAHKFKSKTFSHGLSSVSGSAQPAGLMAPNQRAESSRLTPSFTLVPTPEPQKFSSTRDSRGGTSEPKGNEANHRPESPLGGRSMSSPRSRLKAKSFTFGLVSKTFGRLRKMLTGVPAQPSSSGE